MCPNFSINPNILFKESWIQRSTCNNLPYETCTADKGNKTKGSKCRSVLPGQSAAPCSICRAAVSSWSHISRLMIITIYHPEVVFTGVCMHACATACQTLCHGSCIFIHSYAGKVLFVVHVHTMFATGTHTTAKRQQHVNLGRQPSECVLRFSRDEL